MPRTLPLLFALLLLLLPAGAPAVEEPRLSAGQTVYVPAYSHVFSGDRALPFNLAVTLSIRNTDPVRPITLLAADYHAESGKLVRRYLEQPLVLAPLAATRVFVQEKDESGGFGASFLVRWQAGQEVNAPVVECVMIGARGGQGISFISPGRALAPPPR
jgi:hypothetical protein